MREGARRALIAVAGAAVVAAAAWASRDLPDPVGEAVEAACAATIPREGPREGAQEGAQEGRGVEIVSLVHDRSPLAPEEWGPSGPAGDTLHEVEIAFDRRGPGGVRGGGMVRCAYADDAASAGFDPSRLTAEIVGEVVGETEVVAGPAGRP